MGVHPSLQISKQGYINRIDISLMIMDSNLHGDALKDGEHGEANVVERGDAIVRTLPFLQTNGNVGLTSVGSNRCLERVVRMARNAKTALGHDFLEVIDGVASLVQGSRVKFQSDDGKYEDGKHDEEPDLHERRQGLEDGLEHHLEA